MTNKRKIIAVMFGGQSPEHEISIISGELVISELKKQKYKVVPIYITKRGKWVINESVGELNFFKGDSLEIESKLKHGQEYNLNLNKSVELKKLVLKENKSLFAKELVVDMVFPVFHGQNGEDGTIQGLLEFLNIAYVGNNIVSSAISMDKALSLSLCGAKNLPTVKFNVLYKNQKKGIDDYCREAISGLSVPFFVKPARLGSSIGISKAHNKKELKQAIELAFSYDQKIIIEEAVDNLKDLTCAVREKEDGELQVSLVQESIFEGDFFNYDDKYIEDGGVQLGKNDKKLIIPAKIEEKLAKTIQELAKKVFKLFDCSGMARVDFLYDKKTKDVYVGEINTIPGTLYHHLWKASGVLLSELIDDLIKVSVKKYQNKNKINPNLEMKILTKANSLKLQYDKK